MDEIRAVTEKYDAEYVKRGLSSVDELNKFALTFFTDVAQLYDCFTRIVNPERNPTGFSLDDAPILGLLVRVHKLLSEVVRYYEANNAELIGILERPMVEAAVTASYLLSSAPEVVEDYRKCSYKDRLRIIRELKAGSPFYQTKAGKRLLVAVQEKLDIEGLTPHDFKQQKDNRWRIQGKSFFEIFAEVEDSNLYASTYGMMSESIHGSWNGSLDWDLIWNDDGSYSAFPGHHPADIRYVAPMLKFTNRPYRMWLARIDAADAYLVGQLDWIDKVNDALFLKFDALFDGP